MKRALFIVVVAASLLTWGTADLAAAVRPGPVAQPGPLTPARQFGFRVAHQANLITLLPTPQAVVNGKFTMTNIVCNECGSGCPGGPFGGTRTVVVTLQATAAVPSGYGVSSLWTTNYSVTNVTQSTSAALSAGQQFTVTITGDVGDCGSNFQVWFDMCDNPPGSAADPCLASSMGDGTSQSNAGRTCKTIQEGNPLAVSGPYWIDPDNDGVTTNAFQVYCDMVTNGGGWTLVARMTSYCNTFSRSAVGILSSPSQGTCAKLSDAAINALRLASASGAVFWGWHDGGPYNMTGPRFLKIVSGEFDALNSQSSLSQQCSCSATGPWSAPFGYHSGMAGVYNHSAGGWECVTQGQNGCTAANTNGADLFLYQHWLQQAGTFPADTHGVPGGSSGYLFIR